MIVEIDPEDLVIERKFQGICKKPFYGHPKGCPNYGKKEGCPPGLPLIDEVFDFSERLYLIYTEFEVGEHAERMRVGHPEWSEHPRQWYNPRRWQPTARKNHRADIVDFLDSHEGHSVNKTPEAHGIHISELMKLAGIELRWGWPPEHDLKDEKYLENKSYIVSLGGRKLS